jgi:eukaryotic-like serine/threonine-protein kinase
MANAKWAAFLVMMLLLAPMLTFSPVSNAQTITSGEDWPMFRHDFSHSGVTASVEPTSAVKRWDFKEGHSGGFFGASSAAVVNGIVYVGSYLGDYEHGGGNIYALNADTGAKVWNYSTQTGVYSSPAISENRLFIGADDYVIALDALAGTKIWSFETCSTVRSSPAVINGVVFIGSDDGNIYALNASTGSKIWNYTTGGSVVSSPAVDNGMVYVGSEDGYIYALETSSGTRIWNSKIWNRGAGFYAGSDSSPTISNGTLYLYTSSAVYALNALNGQKIWSTPMFTGDISEASPSPAVAYGIVYIGSDVLGMHALNASTGEEIWNAHDNFLSEVYSSAAVSNGVIYTGGSRFIYALMASTGDQIWAIGTDNQITASPTVSNGVLYIGSHDGFFYAIGNSTSVPTLIPPKNVLNESWILILVVSVAIVITVFAILVYHKKIRIRLM